MSNKKNNETKKNNKAVPPILAIFLTGILIIAFIISNLIQNTATTTTTTTTTTQITNNSLQNAASVEKTKVIEINSSDSADTIVKKIDSDLKEEPIKEIKEGLHYEVLKTPLSLPVSSGDVISEFFWLSCPHCQNFEPVVNNIEERLNKEKPVSVIKTAVPGSARWSFDAKVHLTMMKMGANKEQVSEMLKQYQMFSQRTRKLPEINDIEGFFAKVGLDEVKAMDILKNDDEINKQLVESNKEFNKLGSGGVPVFVVNGKYKLLFDDVKENEDLYKILRAMTYLKK